MSCRCWRADGFGFLNKILEIQCSVFTNNDARVDAVEGNLAQCKTERFQVALDVIQLQAFPFQQVFLCYGVDGMEGANAGTSFEGAGRFAIFEGDVHIHVGVGCTSQYEDVQVGREVVLEIANRQTADVNTASVVER